MEVRRHYCITLQTRLTEKNRERVEQIYIPPQISEEEDIPTLLSQHMSDYRRFYIEHPRIRLDGVYIAVCHYMYVEVYRNIFLCLQIPDWVALDVTDSVNMLGLM